MESKTAIKIVLIDCGNRKVGIHNPVVEYIEGEYVGRPDDLRYGALALFDCMENVRKFLASLYREESLEIWEADYKPSSDEFLSCPIRTMISPPRGTVFAEAVKLTKHLYTYKAKTPPVYMRVPLETTQCFTTIPKRSKWEITVIGEPNAS